ncbi:MAG: SGNH/GDSL hydrolase family protein [Prevotella sp.]|nr:SGNH/GDSL hydrolase family protein [Prevotella sp.]
MKRILSTLAFLFLSLSPTLAQTTEPQRLRMGVIGDSYVRNHREPVENTWHYKFAQRHGFEYINYGRNGACVSIDRQRFGPALWKRYQEMSDSLDLVIVIAGHNDAALLDSIGLPLYRQRLGEVCQGLIARYPETRILWFTPWSHDDPNFLQIVDATIDVCGSWGIPVFDAYRRSNIFARDDRFRDIYFQSGRRDHAHLNARGHDRFLPVAESFIMQYLNR